MIYFIQTYDEKYIKIGYSRFYSTTKQRFSQLQSGQPDKLKPLKIIHGSRKTEKYLHIMFLHLRKKGEWFYATKELLHFIDNPKIPKILNKCRRCKYVWTSKTEREIGCPNCNISKWWLKKKRKQKAKEIIEEYIIPFEYIIDKDKYEKLICNKKETIIIPKIKTNNLLKNIKIS